MAHTLPQIHNLEAALDWLKQTPLRIAFTISFGKEGQMLGHLLHTHGINCDFITIDTGRNFPEYYEIWHKTERFLNRRIKSLHAQPEAVQSLLDAQGPMGFYDSVANREACCNIRKVVPLQDALKDYDVWVTAIRREQNTHRSNLNFAVHNEKFNLIKLAPLLDISKSTLETYIKTHKIPVNPLHKKGYASIGCQPCTRPIADGEHERDGRWWWENTKKECGLHLGK